MDKYTIRLGATTDVTIDVLSKEGGGYDGYSFPTDLGFPDGGPTNGSGNDLLASNIYVFNSEEAVLYYRNGTKLCYSCEGCHHSPPKSDPTIGYPGCDAPSAFSGRNPLNPYVEMSGPGLSAGDYVVAIGAHYLNETDASSGTNNNSNISGWADPGSGFYNNYKITFTFTPQ
ncbi:MAG: hypothetical protein JRI64_09755 [Deltaproteobacteria bacterium]|nr:hypothetical protein [Deltaproteobacteria bacterium]